MASINDVIEGLQILAKHDKNWLESHDIGAGHEVIYGPGPEDVPAEDRRRLEELGWHFDREVESWARFV